MALLVSPGVLGAGSRVYSKLCALILLMLTCRDVAGVTEDLHRSALRPADEVRMSGEPDSSLLDSPVYSRSLTPSPAPWAGARGSREGFRPCALKRSSSENS